MSAEIVAAELAPTAGYPRKLGTRIGRWRLELLGRLEWWRSDSGELWSFDGSTACKVEVDR